MPVITEIETKTETPKIAALRARVARLTSDLDDAQKALDDAEKELIELLD